MNVQLKVALVERQMKYRDLCYRFNKAVGPGRRISEIAITRLVTGRTVPKPGQAKLIARILGRPVDEIFETAGK